MRKFFLTLLLITITLGLFMSDAEARRFGIQQSVSSFSRASSSAWVVAGVQQINH